MGDSLFVVLLAGVFLCLEIGLPENSVVIDGDFRVCSNNGAVLKKSQRVDFNEIAILLNEALVQMLEEEDNLALVVLESEICGSFNEFLNIDSLGHINVDLEDLLWVIVSHVLDVHSSCFAVNENRLACLSVECDAQVEFFVDGQLLYYIDTVAWEAGFARLLCDEGFSAHMVGNIRNFFGSLDDVHSTLVVVLSEVTETSTAA